MKTPEIWSYLIHLGYNMWLDKYSAVARPGEPGYGFSAYSETLLTDEKVWDEVIRFLPAQGINTVLIDLGEGVVYESHPELAIKGSWPKEKLLRKLDEIRALGMEPIPKMNFSACHDAWLQEHSHRLSTPEYHAVVRELIDEVCELFGHPRLFHLGMDEEDAYSQQFSSYAVIRGEYHWWNDLYKMIDCVERNGARPWVWSDYYWAHPEIFKKKMPREVLQSNWEYIDDVRNEDGSYILSFQTYLDLDELGYDQVPTSSTYCSLLNTGYTVRFGRENLSGEHLAGFMTAPWLSSTPDKKAALLKDAAVLGEAKKSVYGE